MEKNKTQKYIVRANGAGVLYGEITKFDNDHAVVEMKDARKIWYWSGAAAVEQLAVTGPQNPERCKITLPVPKMTVCNVLQVLECTDEAVETIDAIKAWRI